MGLVDIVSKRFYESVDLALTWKHLISANWVAGGKLPVCAGTDAEVELLVIIIVLDNSLCRCISLALGQRG